MGAQAAIMQDEPAEAACPAPFVKHVEELRADLKTIAH
jgi:hypothetical protein